tara:strand:- start:465 stop:1277 length:813 start_codon:yes stop_codon:yes gene_type:complete
VKSFIRLLVYSNIWVAFCALGLTISTEVLFGTANLKVSQFVFSATIFTYNFQRVVNIKKGLKHMQKSWLANQSIAIYLLMACGGLVSAYRFFEFQLLTQVVIVIVGLLSVLYPFGLRKIPFIKIFVISFVWVISTMLLLVIENNIPISQNIIFHLIARFLFVFAITIPFDIRDLKYDAQNFRTIPLFFGALKSQFIAISALFICTVIAIFQYFENALIYPNLLALILLYFMSSILIVKSDESKGEFHFSFWVESLSILGYLFLVIMLLIF